MLTLIFQFTNPNYYVLIFNKGAACSGYVLESAVEFHTQITCLDYNYPNIQMLTYKQYCVCELKGNNLSYSMYILHYWIASEIGFHKFHSTTNGTLAKIYCVYIMLVEGFLTEKY